MNRRHAAAWTFSALAVSAGGVSVVSSGALSFVAPVLSSIGLITPGVPVNELVAAAVAAPAAAAPAPAAPAPAAAATASAPTWPVGLAVTAPVGWSPPPAPSDPVTQAPTGGGPTPAPAPAPTPTTTKAPTTTLKSTSTTLPPGVEISPLWIGKTLPPIPPGCEEPHLEDDGVWNCG